MSPLEGAVLRLANEGLSRGPGDTGSLTKEEVWGGAHFGDDLPKSGPIILAAGTLAEVVKGRVTKFGTSS